MLIKIEAIIQESWKIYIKNWKKLIPYMILLFIPNFILGLSGILSLYLDKYADSGAFILTNNLIVLIIFVASIIFTLWAGMALAKNLGRIIAKKEMTSLREAFSSTSHLIWAVLYTSILVMLIVLGGTILFIVPGIIFSVWYAFIFYTIIFEEKKGLSALRASKKLVTGRWWAILWRLFIPGLFYAAVLLVISYIFSNLVNLLLSDFSFLIVNGLLNSIVSAVISPLTALATIVLYFSARESLNTAKSNSNEQSQEQIKKCSECQEDIQLNAKKCKHCGDDLKSWFIKHKIITGILVLFVIMTIIYIKDNTFNNSNSPLRNNSNQQKNIKEENKKIISNSLNLSRAEMTSVLEKPAIGFSFKEGTPVNGQENFVANKGGNIVQLLGPSENLQEISIIALLGNDAGENMASLTMVIGFANIVDKSSIDWISSEFTKIVNNPSDEYSNYKIFDNKIFEIQFTSSNVFNSFSLIVTPSI